MYIFKKDNISPGLVLGSGAIFGFVLAVFGLLFPEKGVLSMDSAAEVNGTSIGREEYIRALAGYASDSKNPITEEIKFQVLERLIEEELLVQRGLELGLADQDRLIRAGIVRSVIQSVISETSSKEPNDLELRIYYISNKEKFSGTQRYLVSAFETFDERSAWKASEEWKEKGKPNQAVFIDLPASPLPIRKLLDYLGPEIARVIVDLKPGEISSPIQSGNKYLIVKLISSEPGVSLPFQQIREEIKAYYLQEKGDKVLRDYLEFLKRRAKIERFPAEER
ncbi:peptidyl-prolyl cis-trans isomerase [Leptospira saintgironsiae]|uniref:peptidylprolyl isomerase n=1 Tax=Leptospira saintgironsiae TaxID=2023183 RepID=A0A2M9YDX0_9LEPT|nr:peptidylprolyl isomerase [Leptospira saintgironsiae]PJZ49752.1 peptidylprolyl isomerase [Leptospira saintgironsiae]